MVKEEERELHKLMSNYAKEEKNMKRKLRIIACMLASLLVFSVYPINSFAMDTQESPDDFKELNFEERLAWVTKTAAVTTRKYYKLTVDAKIEGVS